jgi:integrase
LNATCRTILQRPHIYRPISRDHLYLGIAKLARRAQIPPCGPHALRHWCATQLLLRGVPIALVAKILGHSVQVCERTYAHILPQDLRHLTEVLDQSPL